MEFIRGKDLEALVDVAEGFLPVEAVRQWAIEICDVLSYLHQVQPAPIIHRNLKPSHVMVDRFRRAIVIDFSFAVIFEVGNHYAVAGTEGYMPPEQYRREPSPQSDIYGLGATLHHVLTRRDPRLEPPFSWVDRPIQQFNPAVSNGFVAVVNRALALEPSERFSTAAEMKQALEVLPERWSLN